MTKVIATTVLALAALALASLQPSDPLGPNFSGRTSWDPASGTLTFESDGSMPETQEGFFWTIPPRVKRVVIGPGVTVRGGFRVSYRAPDNPLSIEGADRETSVLFGTETQGWTDKHGIAETEKWKYGSVSVLADAVVHVTNLTAKNPRGYNISGYANRSVIHVRRCNLIDTRPGDNNNSDGFAGAAGSSIRDTLISTSDDAIKVYNDITIQGVTIEQHRNGAPIQLGWGGQATRVTARIRDLTIRGVDPERRYNMAPFTWERGNGGTRDLDVDGLVVDLEGSMFDEAAGRWVAAGLFELKPSTGTFHLRAANARIRVPDYGLRTTPGTVSICGIQEPRHHYDCGAETGPPE